MGWDEPGLLDGQCSRAIMTARHCRAIVTLREGSIFLSFRAAFKEGGSGRISPRRDADY